MENTNNQHSNPNHRTSTRQGSNHEKDEVFTSIDRRTGGVQLFDSSAAAATAMASLAIAPRSAAAATSSRDLASSETQRRRGQTRRIKAEDWGNGLESKSHESKEMTTGFWREGDWLTVEPREGG